MANVSEPLQQEVSGNLGAWSGSAVPLDNVACGVYNAKAFKYVELANCYPLEYSVSVSHSCWVVDTLLSVSLVSFLVSRLLSMILPPWQ